MTKTEHYQLPQWVESDRILMEDFNEAMGNIDKGMDGIRTESTQGLAALTSAMGTKGQTCRIETGTYVGTGAYGDGSRTSVTTTIKPQVLFVSRANGDSSTILFRPSYSSITSNGTAAVVYWEDRKVSWSAISSTNQMNVGGVTYYYIALGTAD